MKYLFPWVTHDGIKSINKNRSNKEYDSTDFPEGRLKLYRFNKLLSIYVGKMLTYIGTLN